MSPSSPVMARQLDLAVAIMDRHGYVVVSLQTAAIVARFEAAPSSITQAELSAMLYELAVLSDDCEGEGGSQSPRRKGDRTGGDAFCTKSRPRFRTHQRGLE